MVSVGPFAHEDEVPVIAEDDLHEVAAKDFSDGFFTIQKRGLHILGKINSPAATEDAAMGIEEQNQETPLELAHSIGKLMVSLTEIESTAAEDYRRNDERFAQIIESKAYQNAPATVKEHFEATRLHFKQRSIADAITEAQQVEQQLVDNGIDMRFVLDTYGQRFRLSFTPESRMKFHIAPIVGAIATLDIVEDSLTVRPLIIARDGTVGILPIKRR